MNTPREKILMLRFSSLGDVVESLSVASRLAEIENSEIHWVVRRDFSELVLGHPKVCKVWTLDRKTGWRGLLQLLVRLDRENFHRIYDAHNNLRSHLLSRGLQLLRLARFQPPPLLLRKSQKRWWRFLLFRLRINRYRQPFSGQRDLLEPLSAWRLSEKLPEAPQIYSAPAAVGKVRRRLGELGWEEKSFWVVAASAAHKLKRWPLNNWKELLAKNPTERFLLVGGPEDDFLTELNLLPHVRSWVGQTTLAETVSLVALSRGVLCNDTGVLHIAEQLGLPALAFMGPAPFGFPSRPTTQVLELKLPCRPCSKHGQGPCTNLEYQKCLVGIDVAWADREFSKMIGAQLIAETTKERSS